MAVYKRKMKNGKESQYYWMKFKFEGQAIQQSTKCTSLRKAQAYEADKRSQLNHRRIGIETLKPAKKSLTLSAAIDEFLAWSESNNKLSTHKRYLSSGQPLKKFFPREAADSITKDDVDRFVSWRRQQKKKAPARKLAKDPKAASGAKIKPATVNRDVTLLSAVYSWLIERDLVIKNPAKGVKKLDENNMQERVVNRDEFNAYIMASSQPLRDIAIIIYDQGMRPSEVTALRRGDIDFLSGTLRVQKGKTKAARRRLMMTPTVAAILEKRCQNPETDLLFAGGRKGQSKSLGCGSNPVEKVTNAHHAAVSRAGVSPFRLYDLRHTFATEFVASGGDLVTLAATLGHNSLTMVMRYAHPTEQHQAAAMERLQRFRNGESNIVPLRRAAG